MLSRLKDRTGIVFWLFVLAVVVPAVAAAQDQPPKAHISIAMSRTARNATTFTPASGGGELRVGETGSYYVYTTADGSMGGQSSGKPPEAYATGGGTGGAVRLGAGGVAGGVAGGIVSSPSARPPLQYDYLWQADVKVVSIAIDAVTFKLDWRRTDVKDGARQVAAGDHRTITLRQGEKHLLDFISCTPLDSKNANVFVEVKASPVEDASMANLTFSYDLWLVHQTAEGTKITRHAIVTGRQGEKLSFNFASIPLQLDRAAAADADSPYRLQVDGTIVGRLRPDGTVEIALAPTRAARLSTGGGGFGAGAKTFSARLDETTSIALPSGSGFSSRRMEPGFALTSPRPGVSMSDGTVRIDLKPFFEGTDTAILVTAHRGK